MALPTPPPRASSSMGHDDGALFFFFLKIEFVHDETNLETIVSGQETLEGPSAPETSSTAEQETAEPVTSGPAAGQEAAGLPAPALSAGGPQAPGSSLGGHETSEPSFAAGPSDRTAGTSRSVGGGGGSREVPPRRVSGRTRPIEY